VFLKKAADLEDEWGVTAEVLAQEGAVKPHHCVVVDRSEDKKCLPGISTLVRERPAVPDHCRRVRVPDP